MFKRAAFGFMLLGLFVIPVFVAQGQDSTAVVSGESVEGQLDNGETLFYTYEGAEDEVILIKMEPIDEGIALGLPSVALIDADGNEIALFDGYGDVTFPTLLPSDQTYTIRATRYDNEFQTSDGKFNFSVTTIPELQPGDTVEGEFELYEKVYYVYRGANDFILSYTNSGKFIFGTSLELMRFDRTASPIELDYFRTVRSEFEIDVALRSLPGGEIYVILLEGNIFEMSEQPEGKVPSYTLSITESEK